MGLFFFFADCCIEPKWPKELPSRTLPLISSSPPMLLNSRRLDKSRSLLGATSEGDTVRHTEFDWVAQVEKHRYGHLFVKTSSNPQDELKKYVEKQQIDLEHPLAADDVRLQEPK